jgi:regulator of protease activity HflC (stomatin/prohibitin superfamily)
VLQAQGEKEAAILRAEGEAKAIDTVFTAIHEGNPDEGLLRYTYLQMLPQLARGEANKVFVIPGEITQALGQVGKALSPGAPPAPAPRDDHPT